LPTALLKRKLNIAEPALSTCRYIETTLASAGYEAWLVGGSVRDLLIANRLSDLDYTTNATPQQVQKIFARTVPVGIKFGTILVLHKGQKVEVTTYRSDANYTDGRRPDEITFAKDLATDIRRRDFTINGLAYSVLREEIADHCGGIADLERKILRTIGDSVQRFTEDGLRPIRGCRIAAKLNFSIESTTLAAMAECANVTAKVAPERFFDEWRKTLWLKNKKAFWQNLRDAGIIGAFLPLLEDAFQARGASYLDKVDSITIRSIGVYAAALFYLLDISDRDVLRRILKDTRFPVADARLCESLLRSSLFELAGSYDRLTFKKCLSRVPRTERAIHVRFLHDLRADQNCINFFTDIRRNKEPLDISDLHINGTDMQQLGIKGRAVGEALEKLRDAIVENPDLNEREKLLKLAKA